MSKFKVQFVLPTIPGTPIDSLNRCAAAKGSPGYARQTANVNFNGHHVTLSWNDCRGYYITEYFWAERVVLARGSFAECFRAAVSYYEKGHIGAAVWFSPKEDDTEALELIATNPAIITKEEDDAKESYMTWQHHCAIASVKDYCFPGAFAMRFDWELMQAAASEDDYKDALKAKYGNTYY
jgi:hypothetical protein